MERDFIRGPFFTDNLPKAKKKNRTLGEVVPAFGFFSIRSFAAEGDSFDRCENQAARGDSEDREEEPDREEPGGGSVGVAQVEAEEFTEAQNQGAWEEVLHPHGDRGNRGVTR